MRYILLLAVFFICLSNKPVTELERIQPYLSENYVNTIYLSDSDIRAFPGAEGFGRNAGLGLPRRVEFVTSTNNTGSGTLRAAIDAAELITDSVTVAIFRVGSTITLGSDPLISGTGGAGVGNIYIAGQTAPGDGINIRGDAVTYGGMLWLRGSNTIVRYIRIHGGTATGASVDALTIATQKNTTAHTVENIIVDHCSFYWGKDENIEVGAYDGSTMQNVSITNSIYAENFGTGYGALFYSTEGYMDNITFYGNLGVDIKERQPYMSSCNQEYEVLNNMLLNTEHVNNFSVNKIDWVGNHYKWNSSYPMTDGGNLTFNYTVNTFEVSPNIATCPSDPGCCDNASLGDLPLYVGDNLLTNDTSGNTLFSPSLTTWNAASRVITESLITPIPSEDVESTFIGHVGASLVRDGHDTRVTDEFIANDRNYRPTGEADGNVGGHETYSSGTPYTDTDGDGMSDAFETANGGDLDINDILGEYTLADGVTKVNQSRDVTNWQTTGMRAIDVFLADSFYGRRSDWDSFTATGSGTVFSASKSSQAILIAN
jgi:hypothetical protein